MTYYWALLQHLVNLRDEFLMQKLQNESSPDVSTLSIPREKLSTASQTDLSGDVSFTVMSILYNFVRGNTAMMLQVIDINKH